MIQIRPGNLNREGDARRFRSQPNLGLSRLGITTGADLTSLGGVFGPEIRLDSALRQVPREHHRRAP